MASVGTTSPWLPARLIGRHQDVSKRDLQIFLSGVGATAGLTADQDGLLDVLAGRARFHEQRAGFLGRLRERKVMHVDLAGAAAADGGE